jgi:nucleotide-binding universal stress UspA family protein
MPLMFKHILVAYDGSDASERAFRVAVALARAFGGRVRVVSVCELPPSPLDALPVVAEDERAWAGQALAELARSVPASDCAVDSELAFGIPAKVLLDQAVEHAVDHIVIGRTGKGGIARLLLGSVSRDVAGRAKVGVTLVP